MTPGALGRKRLYLSVSLPTMPVGPPSIVYRARTVALGKRLIGKLNHSALRCSFCSGATSLQLMTQTASSVCL